MRFDKGSVAGVVLALALLFTLSAGSGLAEAAHPADRIAHAVFSAHEKENGPIGFGWTGEHFRDLSEMLYFLDGLSPLKDENLRLIAGQRYLEGALEDKAREKAIEFARNAAIANILMREGQPAEPYVIGLRLFDAADAPLILKVSLRLADGQIICVELGENGEASSFAVLEKDDNPLIPFVLNQHFLGTSYRPPKWHDPAAPDAFWTEMEHRLIRCGDETALIRSFEQVHGVDTSRWPIAAQAIQGLWDENDQNGLKAIPMPGDISQEHARQIARRHFGQIGKEVYTTEELARMVQLFEFKYGLFTGGAAKWIVWFTAPDGTPAGFVVIDAQTAEILDSFAGPGKG